MIDDVEGHFCSCKTNNNNNYTITITDADYRYFRERWLQNIPIIYSFESSMFAMLTENDQNGERRIQERREEVGKDAGKLY